MTRFIDDHRDEYGVEPICRVIPVASSTYYAFKAREADPSLRSQRAKRDEKLKPEIQRVWVENFQVYGAEKVWRQRMQWAYGRHTYEEAKRDLKAIRAELAEVNQSARECPDFRVNGHGVSSPKRRPHGQERRGSGRRDETAATHATASARSD